MNKSNIAVFSLAYAPFEGGAEIAAREVIKRQKGLNFTVFTYKFDSRWLSKERQENVEIIRFGKGSNKGKRYGRVWNKIFYIFSAWQEAERLHRQKRFQAIWAIMASYGGIAALFFKLNHPGIPFLLTIQEGDSEKHMVLGKFGLVGFFGGMIIKKADYIQAISSYLKDFVKRRGAKAPIEIIPNGVDLELFGTGYTNAELKAARANLGLQDEYVIVTTSRLVYKNGIDTLIEAIAICKSKMLNMKCLIIGDGPEYKNLKSKVSSLKLENNVLFLGQISQRDIPLYLKVSDIFVRPSRSEGLGSSFLEAMAAGLPVIGTPVGGITDFLKDPSTSSGQATGLFAKVNNPKDLAEKIHRLLMNPELRKNIIKNGQLLVQENYSWDRIAGLFKNIFDKLINT
ncbi:MAG: glycosyltransferase family 4 protein [Candidatus Harrisonbacteria bacterium]|nr:glycosyltransferase family 4 protein [Candidatus Harrisonbacteria bacterium]